MLTQAPFSSVGLVETEYAQGSGSVVATNVVLSAAHVFFDDRRLAWTPGEWTWRRAASPTGGTAARRARALRVLAGYSSAISQYTPASGASLEEFNRDTVCLIFYDDVADGHPLPVRANSAAVAGAKMTVGYPAYVGEQAYAWYQMSAQGGSGGVEATFERLGPTLDRAGYANACLMSEDLASGPGASGGPLCSSLDRLWQQTAVLVGGAADFSAVVVREIDDEVMMLIDAAKSDVAPAGDGSLVAKMPQPEQGWAVCFDEKGTTFLATDGLLRLLDESGHEIRHFSVGLSNPQYMAKGPNGVIYVSDAYGLKALSDETGELLWNYGPAGARPFAVGVDGTAYAGTDPGDTALSAISPAGTLEWQTSVLLSSSLGDRLVAVLRDGTVVIPTRAGVAAFKLDGSLKWEQVLEDSQIGGVFAVGPDDTVYVASFGPKLHAIGSDGARKWTYSALSGTSLGTPLIAPDGTIYISHGGEVQVLSPAGVKQLSYPLSFSGASGLQLGRDGTLYTCAPNEGVRARTADGRVLWEVGGAAGRIFLSPGGQLFVNGSGSSLYNLLILNAGPGAAAETWSPLLGGNDGTRRVAGARPGPPRLPGWMADQTVPPGGSFTLRQRVAGTGPFSYTWKHDGVVIPGATTDGLSIPAATASDAGHYTLTVANSGGVQTSPEVSVTVSPVAVGGKFWEVPLRSQDLMTVGPDGSIFRVGRDARASDQTFYLFCLDTCGNERWRAALNKYDRYVNAMLVADDGAVIVSANNQVTAFSTAGGVRWKSGFYETDLIANLALAPDGDVLAGGNGLLLKLNVNDGSVRWKQTLSGFTRPMAKAYAAQDGTVFAQFDNKLCGFSADGVKLWETEVNRGELKGLAEEAVVLYQVNSELRAYDTAGALRWTVGMDENGGDVLRRPDGGFFNGAQISTAEGMLVATILSQPRALAVDNAGNCYTISDVVAGYNTAGQQFFTLGAGDYSQMILTPSGRWIGGSPTAALRATAPLASATWSAVGGNSAHTGRRAATGQSAGPVVLVYSSRSAFSEGDTMELKVTAAGQGALAYRWQYNGSELPGETDSYLNVDAISPNLAGEYRVWISDQTGTTSSIAWNVQVAPASPRSGFYWAESGGAHYLIRISADDRLDVIADTANGGFFARGIGLDASGHGEFFLRGGTASLQITDQMLALTLTDGTKLNLSRSSGLSGGSPRPDVYVGGVLGVGLGEFMAIVDPTGRWVWRAQTETGDVSGAGVIGAGALEFIDDRIEAAFADGSLRASFGPVANRRKVMANAAGLGRSSQLQNLSTRGWVQAGGDPMISGFVTTGQENETLLLRGIGPTLRKVGVTQALDGAKITLLRGDLVIGENLYWWSTADEQRLRLQAQTVGAFALTGFSLDSALLRDLQPALYTVQVRPAGATSGVALSEVYDAGTVWGDLRTTRPINLSTRGFVGSGERVLIAGFVIAGQAPKRVLLRAVGPELAKFGVTNVVSDPQLDVYAGSEQIARNDNWSEQGDADALAHLFSELGAFAFPKGSSDAAIVLTLEPGVYTAIVRLASGNEGTALVEIYDAGQ